MTAGRPSHLALIVLAVVVMACTQAPVSPDGPGLGAEAQAGTGVVRVSDEAGVTVKVAWAGASAGAVFEVTLDTHSGDLDPLDLAGAALRNDRGEQVSDAAWDAPSGGHHRSGALRFGTDAAALLAGARWIELVIPDVADVAERVLRWQVDA